MKTTTAQGKNISQRAKIMAPHTTREQILKCFCSNCYYFLPINYNWVWWSLVFVSTWLLLTASTSKRKTKGSTLVFNTMLQTFHTTNRKIPEQYQSFEHFFSFCIRTNILLFKYLHITSWVMSTRHISGFLSWPSYTMGWSEKKICSVTIQQLKRFDLFGSAFF